MIGFNKVNKKLKHKILVGTSAFMWRDLAKSNDVIFIKAQVKYPMHVIFSYSFFGLHCKRMGSDTT